MQLVATRLRMYTLPMKKTTSGFTIVELLIVIVVIAILAAISVVAYNGIQLRAENNKTIVAANQTLKLLTLYKEINGTYPNSGTKYACIGSGYQGDVCFSSPSVGTTAEVNATFNTALQSVGTLPNGSTKNLTMDNGNIVAGLSFETGNKMIRYHLEGANQSCGISGSTGPYTYGTVTQCRIVLP